jgi:hypothetical protein
MGIVQLPGLFKGVALTGTDSEQRHGAKESNSQEFHRGPFLADERRNATPKPASLSSLR